MKKTAYMIAFVNVDEGSRQVYCPPCFDREYHGLRTHSEFATSVEGPTACECCGLVFHPDSQFALA